MSVPGVSQGGDGDGGKPKKLVVEVLRWVTDDRKRPTMLL